MKPEDAQSFYNGMIDFFESNGFERQVMPDTKYYRYKEWWIHHEKRIMIDVDGFNYDFYRLPKEAKLTYEDLNSEKYYYFGISFAYKVEINLEVCRKLIKTLMTEIEQITE